MNFNIKIKIIYNVQNLFNILKNFIILFLVNKIAFIN